MREAQIQAGLVYKVDKQQGPTVRHGQLCSISYNKTIMQENRTSLVAQMVKCLSLMWETRVRSLGWEDPLGEENGNLLQYYCLENPMDRGAW